MSTSQCRRLRRAYRFARLRPSKAIVLMGGQDLWSNAIDDLVQDTITTDSHLTCEAMAGNAGAGGVILALTADVVYAGWLLQ